MKFEIDFNEVQYNNDKFLIEVLGGYYVKTNSKKYSPFEIVEIEVRDFEHLEDILKMVDKEFNSNSTALISFDNPTIFIEL